jgi:phospholipid/cholesterol/gamma-HCH transport system substrate-binding protein
VRPAAVALAAVAASALLAGCGFSNIYSLPLPGGAANGPTYSVTVIFDDASNLGQLDGVRVNDVPVGEVSTISLTKDLKAMVKLKLRRSVNLPRNATATIEATSLLGEKFVALAAPLTGAATGQLANGDLITGGASTDPDAEQVLGALSAVLNGGSIGQLHVIVSELDNALSGHSSEIRSLLNRLTTFVGALNTNRQSIVDALDGIDHLASELAAQHAKLGTILDELPQGISILSAERPKLTALLSAIAQLGDAATHVINASRASVVADLAALKPILSKLAVRGGEIAAALQIAATYPFSRDSLAAFKGDYAGFYATLNLSADDLANLVSAPRKPASSTAGPPAASTAKSTPAQTPALNLSSLLLGVLGQ